MGNHMFDDDIFELTYRSAFRTAQTSAKAKEDGCVDNMIHLEIPAMNVFEYATIHSF